MKLFIATWATSFLLLMLLSIFSKKEIKEFGQLMLGAAGFTFILALAVWGWLG